jgi:hypothetical protein
MARSFSADLGERWEAGRDQAGGAAGFCALRVTSSLR